MTEAIDEQKQAQADATLVLVGAISAAVSKAIKDADIPMSNDINDLVFVNELTKLAKQLINSLPS